MILAKKRIRGLIVVQALPQGVTRLEDALPQVDEGVSHSL
jgi:hypothetical protein